jgi:LmbE family N-acetylglucosaminyl deacetylase
MLLPTRLHTSRPRPSRLHAFIACAALAAFAIAGAGAPFLAAQQAAPTSAERELAAVPLPEPQAEALPLPEDRGQADLAQTLKRLGTTASVLMIVAHPDDEDGALLTYLTRGLGVRATLLTLTRGEGGQNAMSAEDYDALGLIRTNELLKADEYYGATQLWGTEADFGFSKTQQESFEKWGHDRVLYDAVLAVRMVRPQVIVSTFIGAVSDGHGQHQVSGEVAQEAFKDAGNPKIFPEQLKNGLQPWQPLAVYSRMPFAPITDRGIFDYATGKWAPAKFHNYATGDWTTGELSSDASIPDGSWDAVLGRTYVQIAREGWGMQKSQYGGASPALSGSDSTAYHLWAVAPNAAAPANANGRQISGGLFDNPRVQIDTSVDGLAHLVHGAPPAWLSSALHEIQTNFGAFQGDCNNETGANAAHRLAPIYRQTLDLYARVQASDLDAESKAGLEFELGAKIGQFQRALADLLGLDMIAFTTHSGGGQFGGSGRGGTADETPRSVAPGEDFEVRIHSYTATDQAHVLKTWFNDETSEPRNNESQPGESQTDESWTHGEPPPPPRGTANVTDSVFHLRVPEGAQPTRAYFTRPTTEQPYYDVADESLRERSFAPWPLAAWVEFSFDGLPIRLGKVVQTLERTAGPGGVYEPLVVTPKIGVSVQPQTRVLPLDGSALPVNVTIRAQSAAEGTVTLDLPQGWHSDPAQRAFHFKGAGDSMPLSFSVSAPNAGPGAFTIRAVAHAGGHDYSVGWHDVSYPGLRPYNQYQPATLRTRKIDVKLAPGLRIGYIMGTGDTVPEAIAALGVEPHLLSDDELGSGDLSRWNVLVVGIRAYSTRSALAQAQPRLEEFVRQGGTLVVQYQSNTFPAPLPLSMGRTPERVVDERAPVKLLDASSPLLSWPNKITETDFDGWFEERGHSFLDTWDPGYTALTETADPGQDPQRGGLLVTHPGKGTYIYVAYALYRQFPELVPGSYRLLANLLSAGHEPASR